jgi:hypothetical protein
MRMGIWGWDCLIRVWVGVGSFEICGIENQGLSSNACVLDVVMRD